MALTKEQIEEIARRFPPPPSLVAKRAAEAARAKLTVASENELSLETQQERLAVQARRLFDAQKSAIEQNRRLINERRQAALWPQPLPPGQALINGWAEMRRDAGMYERKLRQELDPTNSGIWGVEPCHIGKGE